MSAKPIQIIYTGGTFGMQPSEKGYVPAPNFAELAAKHLPQLTGGNLPACTISEYDTPFDSANASPETWFDLAGRIRAAAHDHSGFVVIHGTDTLNFKGLGVVSRINYKWSKAKLEKAAP